MVFVCLVRHAAAAASLLPLGATATVLSPPEPHPNDTIVRSATALHDAIVASRFPAWPHRIVSLHVVGHIMLSEAGFMRPDTYIWLAGGQRVTLWSEAGEATLDAEGRGRVFLVRPTPMHCCRVAASCL